MTTRYRRLGENNEPAMGQGNQDFLEDADAVGQAIITRLRLWKGEWWENIYLGIPMWQEMLGVVGSKKAVIDKIIQDTILDTAGVVSMSNMVSIFDPADRSYKFYCTIDTIYGTTVITNNQGEIDR